MAGHSKKGALGRPVPEAASPRTGAAAGDRAGAVKLPVPEAAAPGRTPELELVCEQGARPGQVFSLAPVRTLLDRADPDAGIVPDIDLTGQEEGLERRTVSRLHAEISRTAEGYVVVDLNSSNGTAVNGRRLDAKERRVLLAGDSLALGQVALRAREKEA
jgi:hypothetical protein